MPGSAKIQTITGRRQGRGKHNANRSIKKAKTTETSISKLSIRRLARRCGVKWISGLVYEENAFDAEGLIDQGD